MGFLLGAYGKLAAGSRMRSLQARLLRVSSKMRQATRQIDQAKKQLNNQKRADLNMLNAAHMAAKTAAQSYGMGIIGDTSIIDEANRNGIDKLTPEQMTQYNAQMSQLQKYQTQCNSNIDQYFSYQKEQLEQHYETLDDIIMEPLKMEEEVLQQEKETLETQIQIAKNDYDACKEMEKEGAKEMKPNYTGQG